MNFVTLHYKYIIFLYFLNFYFFTFTSSFQLLLHSGIENLQIVLSCEVTQKNILLVAVQQAAFCHMMHRTRTVDVKVSVCRILLCCLLKPPASPKKQVLMEDSQIAWNIAQD